MSLYEDGDEINEYHFPQFIIYFIQQWAPIIPLWTATLLCFIENQKPFQNNQAVEAYFSSSKRFHLHDPNLEDEARKDFTKRRNVWEIGSFLRATKDRER